MKKNLLWIALGVTAMTGCTSTEVMDEGIQSNAIGFENVVNKGTRAEDDKAISGDLTNGNFDKFCVYGYYVKKDKEAHPISVFTGDEVTKSGNTWTYENTRYWMPDAAYYFYAYSCADIALGEGKGEPVMNLPATGYPESRTLKINNYVCNGNHQHDLIADAAENIPSLSSGNSTVKFEFKHALCKVSAKFVNDLPGAYEAYISNVQLVNFYDTGDLDIHDNALNWSNPKRTTTEPAISMNIIGDNKATSTLADAENAKKVSVAPVFMLPVTYNNANVKLQFTLTLKNGEDVFLDRTIYGTFKPDWNWGNVYNYIIHITGSTASLEEIKFDASHEVKDITEPSGWSGEINTDMSFSYN